MKINRMTACGLTLAGALLGASAVPATSAAASASPRKIEYVAANGRCATVERSGKVDLMPCRHHANQLFTSPSGTVINDSGKYEEYLGLRLGKPWMLSSTGYSTNLSLISKRENGVWKDTFTYPNGQHIVAGRGSLLYTNASWPGDGKAIFRER